MDSRKSLSTPMRARFRFLLLGTLFLQYSLAEAAAWKSPTDEPNILLTQVPERLRDLAATGIHLNYMLDFKGATEAFQAMMQEYPHHPSGYVCMAGLLESQMIVEHHNNDEARMFELVEKCLSLCESQKREGLPAAASFFAGGARGYMGLHRVRMKEWWRALRDGMAAEDELRQAVKTDPNLYDAYYGLGLYDYYRSRFSQTLTFLPFFSDRREQGIQELKLCADRGLFASAGARTALMWILLDENRLEESEAMADWMVERYPPYWDAWILKARIYEKQGKLDDVARSLTSALSLIETTVPKNRHDKARHQMGLADVLERLGKSSEAVPLYRAVLNWIPSGSKEDLAEARDWKKKASARIEKLAPSR